MPKIISQVMKEKILELNKQGYSNKEIAEQVKLNDKVIGRKLKEWSESKELVPVEQHDAEIIAPQFLTPIDKINEAQEETELQVNSIIEMLENNLSSWWVKKILNECGLFTEQDVLREVNNAITNKKIELGINNCSEELTKELIRTAGLIYHELRKLGWTGLGGIRKLAERLTKLENIEEQIRLAIGTKIHFEKEIEEIKKQKEQLSATLDQERKKAEEESLYIRNLRGEIEMRRRQEEQLAKAQEMMSAMFKTRMQINGF